MVTPQHVSSRRAADRRAPQEHQTSVARTAAATAACIHIIVRIAVAQKKTVVQQYDIFSSSIDSNGSSSVIVCTVAVVVATVSIVRILLDASFQVIIYAAPK